MFLISVGRKFLVLALDWHGQSNKLDLVRSIDYAFLISHIFPISPYECMNKWEWLDIFTIHLYSLFIFQKKENKFSRLLIQVVDRVVVLLSFYRNLRPFASKMELFNCFQLHKKKVRLISSSELTNQCCDLLCLLVMWFRGEKWDRVLSRK